MPKITFVDENDNVIGAGSKEEAWKKGIIHRVVRVFLFNSKGEILITKRGAGLESLPGRWDQSAAGHVDEGEEYATSAPRELEEEVGIAGIDLVEKGKFFHEDTDEADKIKKRFSMIYTGISDGEVKPNPREVSEIKWITPADLKAWMDEKPDDFTESFRESFKFLQGLNY